MTEVSTLSLNTCEVTQNLTIKVSGTKGLRLRMWAAGLIFRFGAAVAGTKLEMDLS